MICVPKPFSVRVSHWSRSFYNVSDCARWMPMPARRPPAQRDDIAADEHSGVLADLAPPFAAEKISSPGAPLAIFSCTRKFPKNRAARMMTLNVKTALPPFVEQKGGCVPRRLLYWTNGGGLWWMLSLRS